MRQTFAPVRFANALLLLAACLSTLLGYLDWRWMLAAFVIFFSVRWLLEPQAQ